jgi:HEAT repeat protein
VNGDEYVGKIRQLCQEESNLASKVRQFANSMGLNTEEAVSALLETSNDSNQEIRLMVACALARIAPHTKEAVTALIKALQDTDPRIHFWAIRALGEIGGRMPKKQSVSWMPC